MGYGSYARVLPGADVIHELMMQNTALQSGLTEALEKNVLTDTPPLGAVTAGGLAAQ